MSSLPPTGKRVPYEVVEILPIATGKLVEHWAVANQLAMLRYEVSSR